MSFIDNTHSIAAASDNGSIHVFRIDYVPGTNSPKYGKPVTVRETYLNEEYAVAMEHYESGIYLFICLFFCSFNIKILYFNFL